MIFWQSWRRYTEKERAWEDKEEAIKTAVAVILIFLKEHEEHLATLRKDFDGSDRRAA